MASIDLNSQMDIQGVVQMPDGSTVELSEEEARAILAEAEEAERQEMEKQKEVLTAIQSRVDGYVRSKAEIEKCMVDDLRQYEGLSRVVGNKDRPDSGNLDNAPKIHRTRSRTDMMEARLTDMLMTHPAWRIKLPKDWEPDPELLAQIQPPVDPQSGQPMQLSPEQIEAQARVLAEERAQRMEERIGGVLDDCRWPMHGRRIIRDACRLGTGLMMGPNSTIRYKRKFNRSQGAVELQIEERIGEPEVISGDPWCFYPELTDSCEKAQGAAYVHLMSAAELQEFAKQLTEGGQSAVARILKKSPELGALGPSLAYRNQYSPFREEVTERYAVWRFIGVVSRDEAMSLGLLEAETEAEQAAGHEVLLPMPVVDIWFCQGEPLKMKLRPIRGDFRIPYYVFAPFPREDCMFGYSLAYLGRDSQRAADAAYEMLLHNSSVSSGPLVFARREAFKPTRGETMQINGPKWLWIDDPDVNVQDVINVVQFPNSAEQLMSVLDRVLQIMDDELNMPQVIGDVSATKPLTQTASGMAMLMNEMVTVIQRRAAAQFDDEVMHPMIERLLWWENLFGDNEEIKGDYEVEVLGQSELLVKDMRVQHLMLLQQLYPQDPDIDDRFIKEEIVRKLDIPVDRGMRSKEEADARRQQMGQDPKAMAAQQQAEAALKRAQIEEQNAQRDDQFRQYDRDLTHQERMAELQLKREQDQKDLLIAQLRQQTEFAKLAQSRELDMTKIQAMLGVEQTKQQTEQYFKAGEMRLKAAEVATRNKSIDAQVRHESPVRIAG